MMSYIRLTKGLQDKGQLISEKENPTKYVKQETDYYTSIYKYTNEQFNLFKKQGGSVAGIEDVYTETLYFDIDKENDLMASKNTAVQILDRVLSEGFEGDAINVYFSGNKGFHITVNLKERLTPEQHRIIASRLAEGISLLDFSIYNPSRIFRLVNTKHPKSGLFKIVLTPDEFTNSSIQDITELAKTPRETKENHSKSDIPPKFKPEVLTIKKQETRQLPDIMPGGNLINWEKKPVYLTNCRFALLNGHFLEGSRRSAFMSLAASFKNQGFPKETAEGLLSGVIEKQAQYSKSLNQFSDFFEEKELTQIVEEVYSPEWRNGQFTCKKEGTWLYQYCQGLGENRCRHDKIDDAATVKIHDVTDYFQKYADSYDKNILYTGIPKLDEKWKLMVGTSNAILAAPGAGKTSLSLQILKNNSEKGINCLFFSYDMYFASVYSRMLQQTQGWTHDQIFAMYKNNKDAVNKANVELREKYKNVNFCFKSGQTIDQIKQTIRNTQNEINDKIKLVIVDYSELVITDVSDMTQASARVAQGLRELAINEEVCVVVLLQPTKAYSNPADEFGIAAAAKGSGSIQQSLTSLIGCSRPGFDPLDKTGAKDQYFNITCLKNRNGGMFSLDFCWDGVRGTISEMDDADEIILSEIRKERELAKEQRGRGIVLGGGNK